ncbi:uncharacterized protein [Euwallacea fornicatus]|uniref:uncharacterized protein n=1 Tax=Euwallacea fornicatus TaxID=995702 RepID=UPI0033904465
MKWFLLYTVLVAILAGQTLAERCQTCRGTACQAKKIAEKDCNEFVSALPFESQLMFNEVDDNAQYGCLNVQYYIGKSLENIRQCVLSNNLDSYCSTLETVVAVKSCKIESTDENRHKREAEASNIEDEEEIEDEITTSEPTTSEPSSAISKHTAVAQFLLISCVVATLLNKLF